MAAILFTSVAAALMNTVKELHMSRDNTHGPLVRYAKLRVAHALGMPGTFSPPLLVSDTDMHHGTCMTHVPWCMSGSLTSGFFWSRWRGKRFRHSQHMRNTQFCVSGKRLMACYTYLSYLSYCSDVIWSIKGQLCAKRFHVMTSPCIVKPIEWLRMTWR